MVELAHLVAGKKKYYLAISLIALLFVFWIVGTYNHFITLQQNVYAKWSEVENQYQRQADLIPNLVNVVKGYMKYEAGLLQNVTELRTRWPVSYTHLTLPTNREV